MRCCEASRTSRSRPRSGYPIEVVVDAMGPVVRIPGYVASSIVEEAQRDGGARVHRITRAQWRWSIGPWQHHGTGTSATHHSPSSWWVPPSAGGHARPARRPRGRVSRRVGGLGAVARSGEPMGTEVRTDPVARPGQRADRHVRTRCRSNRRCVGDELRSPARSWRAECRIRHSAQPRRGTRARRTSRPMAGRDPRRRVPRAQRTFAARARQRCDEDRAPSPCPVLVVPPDRTSVGTEGRPLTFSAESRR